MADKFIDGRPEWVGSVGPGAVQSPLGTITYANGHVIAAETFNNSEFLQALDAQTSFSVNDFTQNGVSLAYRPA